MSSERKVSRLLVCFVFTALLGLLPFVASAYDTRINSSPKEDEFIIAHSAEEKLVIKDLTGLDIKVIELAKNEIYARHGLIFQHDSMNDYFGKKTWYKADKTFKKNTLNDTEAANVKLLEGIMREPQKLKKAEMAEVLENAKLLDEIVRDPQKIQNIEIAETPTPKDLIESLRTLVTTEASADKTKKDVVQKKPESTLPKIKQTKQKNKPQNKGALVVATARTQIGKPYRYGSSDPKKGFDCSGLISWVYKQHGISTPRSTPDLQKIGIKIPPNQLKPGDIVITRNRRRRDSPHGLHAGIYAGNGEMIHAPGRRRHVIKVKMTYFNVKEGRRVF